MLRPPRLRTCATISKEVDERRLAKRQHLVRELGRHLVAEALTADVAAAAPALAFGSSIPTWSSTTRAGSSQNVRSAPASSAASAQSRQ